MAAPGLKLYKLVWGATGEEQDSCSLLSIYYSVAIVKRSAPKPLKTNRKVIPSDVGATYTSILHQVGGASADKLSEHLPSWVGNIIPEVRGSSAKLADHGGSSTIMLEVRATSGIHLQVGGASGMWGELPPTCRSAPKSGGTGIEMVLHRIKICGPGPYLSITSGPYHRIP